MAASREELAIELFCPLCGQRLSLPVRGLHREFLCPRCHTKHRGAELVAHGDALPVLPVESAPEVATAPLAAAPVAPPVVAPPVAAPQVVPPQTEPSYRSGSTLAWEPPDPPAEPIAWTPPAWDDARALPAAREQLALREAPPEAEPRPRSGPSFGSRVATVLRFVTRVCVVIDRRFEGHRTMAIVFVSALGMGTGIAQLAFNTLAFHIFALVLFVLLLFVFAWAYVASLYAEASQRGWRAALGEAFAAAWGYVSSADEDDEPMSASERALQTRNEQQRWSGMLAALALVVYPIASLVGLLAPSLAHEAAVVQGVSVVGLVLGGWLWFRLRTPGQGRPAPRPSGPSDFSRLPPVLLLAPSRDNSQALAYVGGDVVLSELLHQLQRWRPGRREHEKSYEQALVKFLRNRLPQASVRTQMYMTSQDDETLRIDVVVDGRIGIEIKRNLRSTGEVDRCLAQMQRYARTWRQRGPLFLLVCESERDFERSTKLASLTQAQSTDTPFKILIAGHRAR